MRTRHKVTVRETWKKKNKHGVFEKADNFNRIRKKGGV